MLPIYILLIIIILYNSITFRKESFVSINGIKAQCRNKINEKGRDIKNKLLNFIF